MKGDAIAATTKARRSLAAYSRDTGIPKHGDLAQMDQQITTMEADERDQDSARLKAKREGRGR